MKYTGIGTKKMASILSVSENQTSGYENSITLKKDMSAKLIQITDLFIRGFNCLRTEKNFGVG